jgi:pteridine reductase
MAHSNSPALANQTVLITGAARRVGAAIARAAHDAGANVVVHHRSSAAEAAALVAELNLLRAGSAHAVAGDLLDPATPARLVESALATFGGLDVLVNNASSFYPTPVGTITAGQWDDLIGSNLRAPLFLTQEAAPALRARGGLILNLIDIHGFRPLKRHPVYCAAKAGLVMLTQSLARELGPEIRVNGIAPGPVLWPESPMEPAQREAIIERTALKRAGTPADVARTALFFMCDAPYITGQILAVDGGRSTSGH